MVTQLQILLHGARSLVKTAVDRPPAKNLGLDMDSFGGALADYSGTSWGSSRAGRAAHLGDAMGEDPGFGVRHPKTQDVLAGLGGGGLGAGLGMGLASLSNNPYKNQSTHYGIAGGIGGALASVLLARNRRRAAMTDIAAKYDEGAPTDKMVRPAGVHPGVSGGLFAAITPFGGAHRAGQADVYEALNNRGAGLHGNEVADSNIRTLANVFNTFGSRNRRGPSIGMLQGIDAGDRVDRIDLPRREEAERLKREAKAKGKKEKAVA